MNVSAVGTATGSCFSLLSTVLNANFRLFQNEAGLIPTILAIFIRDHFPGQTSVRRISEQLSSSLENIWTEIQKENQSTRKFEEFFELRVISFPHQLFEKEEFIKKCDETRSSLPFPSTYSRGIPADGFFLYCKNIWQKIVDNREIDIPGEKNLIGSFRCDEFKNSTLIVASGRMKQIILKRKSMEIGDSDMKVELQSVIKESLSTYLCSASHYEKTISDKKPTSSKSNFELHASFCHKSQRSQ
eukprot:GHVP01046526.1.p1 GENE.GHVP01046526.1~~GHVP01046526.1.p1  ORF type:complete len:244 (-),score=39.39 GHVP01046526.1:23-754(-)